MRPAEITFPSHVDNLVIVDRTKFDQEAVNVVESILTGEMPGEDATGVQELINSFQQQSSHSPRFRTRVASERLAGNSLTSVFPKKLSWRTVNRLCKKYQAQTVVAIEIFDTDFRISRTFYGKSRKAPALEQGSRYADVGEWQDAISVWKQGIKPAPTKQRGYLSHNIAIAYEVLGDLKAAKKWAQKSYVRYGNKNARSYVSLIQQRLYDKQLAKQQMK